ncbi:MAG: hypothetical protein R6T85_01910 [Egibacteraceae bacterium]
MAHDREPPSARPSPASPDEGSGPGAATTPGARRPRARAWAIAAGAVAALAAIAVVVVLVLDTPGARLARAVETTLDAGSARVSVTGTAADVPVLGDVRLSVADGELDFDAEAARLEREVPFLDGLPIPGLGDVGVVELVFVEEQAWLRAPVDLDRGWVRLTGEPGPDERDPAATGPGVANPLAVVGLLRAVETAPEEVGEEVLDGTATTRYRVEVDLDAVGAQLGEESDDLIAALRRIHPDGQLPVDVWIDDEDYLRRIDYEGVVDLAGLAEVRLGTTIELEDFGVPVEITAPEADAELDPSLDALGDLDPLGWLEELLERVPGT